MPNTAFLEDKKIQDRIKMQFVQRGFDSSESLRGEANSISNGLDSAYVFHQEINIKRKEARISQAKTDIENIEKDIKNTLLDINKHNENIIEFQQEIDAKMLEKHQIEDNNIKSENTIVELLLLIFVGLLLYIFYASNIDYAFNGIRENGTSLINQNIVTEIFEGNLTAALGPVLFLGLAYALSEQAIKNERFKLLGQPKKYWITIGLVAGALIADCYLGYRVASSLHENKFNSGLVDTIWQFDYAFSDSSFWGILAIGFFGYMLLGYLWTKCRLNSPDVQTKRMIERILQTISELKKDIKKERDLTHGLEKANNNKQNEIMQLNREIKSLEEDKVIDITILKRDVANFIEGWINYMRNKFALSLSNEELNQKIAEIHQESDNWLIEKQRSLITPLNSTTSNNL